jgi:endoglucanase
MWRNPVKQLISKCFLAMLLLISACATQGAPKALEPQQEWVWWRGVNLAGAEFAADAFGNGALPGTFGVDYIYPNQGEVDYFKSKGMNIIRLPFRWERLQPALYGPLDTIELRRLRTFVNQTTTKGVKVILDPHNYARYYTNLIGSSQVPYGAFGNFWRRLANQFKNNPEVVFGLMNEPHDMPTEQWVRAANVAIASIRNAGAGNFILVPGNGWSGAWTWNSDWYGTPNAQAMLDIRDPLNLSWFEVHQYMDSDASGSTENCISITIGAERLQEFTAWLRQHNLKGFLGEFSAGRNQRCYQALNNMVAYMESNADVWRGWTYWAAGPWWGDNNSLEPINNQDKPQMNVLETYLPQP